MSQQQTIARSVRCSGIGLHTGCAAILTLHPAPPDTGLVFLLDAGRERVPLPALVSNLLPAQLCTALGGNGSSVKSVEHLLSALRGLDIDNVFIELDAPEVPAMDGSAGPFVRLIKEAGILPQGRRRLVLKILRPIEIADGQRRVAMVPAHGTRITYAIEFDHPLIGEQVYSVELDPASFEREIAEARTFGFLKEVETLWANGLGRGGTLNNTVVLSDSGILNVSGLRFSDEFVRHKILDLIGDLALMGLPFLGHLMAHRSGHALHTKLIAELLGQPDAWTLIALDHAGTVGAAGSDHRPHAPSLPFQTSPV